MSRGNRGKFAHVIKFRANCGVLWSDVAFTVKKEASAEFNRMVGMTQQEIESELGLNRNSTFDWRLSTVEQLDANGALVRYLDFYNVPEGQTGILKIPSC